MGRVSGDQIQIFKSARPIRGEAPKKRNQGFCPSRFPSYPRCMIGAGAKSFSVEFVTLHRTLISSIFAYHHGSKKLAILCVVTQNPNYWRIDELTSDTAFFRSRALHWVCPQPEKTITKSLQRVDPPILLSRIEYIREMIKEIEK